MSRKHLRNRLLGSTDLQGFVPLRSRASTGEVSCGGDLVEDEEVNNGDEFVLDGDNVHG